MKTEQNWSSMMFALLRLSEKVSPSLFKGATPVLSFLRDLMKFQKALSVLVIVRQHVYTIPIPIPCRLCTDHVSPGRSFGLVSREPCI